VVFFPTYLPIGGTGARTPAVFRLIFVFGIIAIGAFYSFQGPFYALLFYLWNAYFRPEAWVWTNLVWSLRLSLVIGAFLLLVSVPALRRFRINTLVLLVMLFFGQTAISLVYSPHQALAMPFWIEFAKVIAVTLLISVLVDSEVRLRLTMAVIAYSLGFEAAKQGWAQLVLNPGAVNVNTHVMLGDNNGVALGMMMLIPIFMALSQTTTHRWERIVHRFFIGGVVYRGVSTYSRGGFLAASLVGLVSLWRSEHKIRTIAIVTILVGTIATVMPQRFWDRMQTIVASEDQRDASARGRLYYWGLAVEMANDHPLTGVGLNSFRYSFEDYAGASSGEGQRAVHSSWFGAMSELGYPGLLIFSAILLTAVRSCYRIRREAGARGLGNIAIYAGHLQTSLLVFVVGGSFLHVQYLELLWHFIGLTIALEHIYTSALTRTDAVASPLSVPVVPVVAAALKPRVRERGPASTTGQRFFFK
jgi:probable O-glycosylation ligase (exosortase A-associated)